MVCVFLVKRLYFTIHPTYITYHGMCVPSGQIVVNIQVCPLDRYYKLAVHQLQQDLNIHINQPLDSLKMCISQSLMVHKIL